MLILTRKVGERIVFDGGRITVRVIAIEGKRVRMRILPRNTNVKLYVGEMATIDGNITFGIRSIKGKRAVMEIEAPPSIVVLREELLNNRTPPPK